MDPERLEKLVIQVLEETRDFRQETREKFAEVNAKFAEGDAKFAEVNAKLDAAAQERRELRRDIGLLQSAVLETATGLKEVREGVNRVEVKLDATIAEHEARLDRLEGAA